MKTKTKIFLKFCVICHIKTLSYFTQITCSCIRFPFFIVKYTDGKSQHLFRGRFYYVPQKSNQHNTHIVHTCIHAYCVYVYYLLLYIHSCSKQHKFVMNSFAAVYLFDIVVRGEQIFRMISLEFELCDIHQRLFFFLNQIKKFKCFEKNIIIFLFGHHNIEIFWTNKGEFHGKIFKR